MLTETYRELLTAVATCAAGLTGLLFVAISVGPGHGTAGRPAVIQQIRAASALLAFSSALAVSLYSLAPGNNGPYAAVASGAIGVLFTAASVRSILSDPGVSWDQAWRQAGLIVVLLAAFGGEVACGIGLMTHRTAIFGTEFLSNILIALLLIGIARAWELVGNRDTGVLSSIAVLTGRDQSPAAPAHPADPSDD